ncbi:hypothetical protein [Leptospira idonii]
MIKIHNWIDDYNTFAPHKGLKMMSPKEFILNELANVCSIFWATPR